jgi:NAD(P)-dependent dehydrogenase (short-subunit alcohol dehydrogenase family)
MDDAGGASAAVQGPRIASERGEPRPGDHADPRGISPDLWRSARRRRHRAGRPRRVCADIAPAVLFLCSDGARWINGANLPVDGGLEASINATVLGF